MNDLGKTRANAINVDDESVGQRVDNFLFRRLKGVPKSHVYRLLRTGEVRVNSKRVEADYRVQLGDRVRIPPLRAAAEKPLYTAAKHAGKILETVIYEDDFILAINKPAGLAVHGGSGISFGAIEQLRAARPELKFIELAHRLDRDTSGVLLFAKKRSALLSLHHSLREGLMDKRYVALVKGAWAKKERAVELPLRKRSTATGERRVSVEAAGRATKTVFRLLEKYHAYSLVEAELETGHTHQIRVHLAHLGYPIVGDDKYGDFELNRHLAKTGMKRMFLHAAKLTFAHPASPTEMTLEAPLPTELRSFVNKLKAAPRVDGNDVLGAH
jgi:23S rRNA pseudouridine955/2504/2580 synthase